MWLFVNGYTEEVDKYLNVGGLLQPRTWGLADKWIGECVVGAKKCWGVDNDCFRGLDIAMYISLLTRLKARYPSPATSGCMFVTVPDVVANADATRDLWDTWRDKVWGYEMPLAYVIQDGATTKHVPWRDFRVLWRDCAYYTGAIFVGGSTAYKLGEDAAAIVRVANRLGLWVHMGRVNSARRLNYAASIGCDSVDGSGYSMFRKLIPAASEIANVTQERLFL